MHEPVLLEEVLEWIAIKADGTYVDCTVGAGGHAERIAQRLTTGRLIALDRDPEAVVLAGKRLVPYPCAQVHQANYGDVAAVLAQAGVKQAEGVLIDAGCSSMQIDMPQRGFSFQVDGPLDMRMDTTSGESAREYLLRVEETELADVLRGFGDVRLAGRLARVIVERREGAGLETTQDLVRALSEGLGLSAPLEETRQVFQAIRMAVNEELKWLELGLEQAIDCLAPGGRLVAISFHSGEDRVMKKVMQKASRPIRELYPDGRIRSTRPAKVTVLTRSPIMPTPQEIAQNRRAQSAKLRAVERIKHDG